VQRDENFMAIFLGLDEILSTHQPTAALEGQR
jgi:hypothetical protein